MCACVEQDKVTKERGYSGIANRVSGSCMSHATVGYQGVVRYAPPKDIRELYVECHHRISGSCTSHCRISGSCTSRAAVGYQGVVRHAPP